MAHLSRTYLNYFEIRQIVLRYASFFKKELVMNAISRGQNISDLEVQVSILPVKEI